MIKKFLGASAMVFACTAMLACSPQAGEKSVQSTEKVVLRETPLAKGEGPAIWKIGDEDTTIYLFGTVHVLPPSLIWRNEKFDAIFESADTVYFEADVSGNDPALARAVLRLGSMPFGEDLFSKLSEEDVTALNEAAAKLNLPTASLARMRPWFAAIAIAMQAIVAEGQDPESGVEKILAPEARAAGKQLRYFETPEEQITFIANLADDVQIKMLMETVRQIDDIGQSIIKMDNAWLVGDLAGLLEVVLSDPSMASEELTKAMLTVRNENWVVELNRLMEKEQGVFFVAVGAAHLIGDQSVLSLLTDGGFQVARID